MTFDRPFYAGKAEIDPAQVVHVAERAPASCYLTLRDGTRISVIGGQAEVAAKLGVQIVLDSPDEV